jgi:hypothetical protein
VKFRAQVLIEGRSMTDAAGGLEQLSRVLSIERMEPVSDGPSFLVGGPAESSIIGEMRGLFREMGVIPPEPEPPEPRPDPTGLPVDPHPETLRQAFGRADTVERLARSVRTKPRHETQGEE